MTIPTPRPADPTATYCRLCGGPDAGPTREHGSCRERVDAFNLAADLRILEDGARAFDRFRAERRELAGQTR